MKRAILGAIIVGGFGLTACNNPNNSNGELKQVDKNVNHKTHNMKNLVSIIEIPTTNFSRAIAFYQAILDIKIEEMEMGGIRMGQFPNTGEGAFVQLIHGDAYKTSADGTLIYFNGGDDLQKVADKIEANGGKIIVPKTEIGPDIGFFAMFTDTEGNKLGLYSKQ